MSKGKKRFSINRVDANIALAMLDVAEEWAPEYTWEVEITQNKNGPKRRNVTYNVHTRDLDGDDDREW